MYPILFSLGQVNFYTHGLLIAIGCLIGGYFIYALARKEQLPTNFLFDLLVLSLLLGIVGARLAYVIAYYYQFGNWHEMFFLWYGGLVSFGGLIFGFLTAGLILKRKQQNILHWFDLGVIGLLIGWAFGRIGCFLSGDVFGIESTSRLSIWGTLPVALFEAIWSLMVAGILFYLYTVKRNFINQFPNGFIFYLGLALYTLGRFLIDFFRQEDVFYILKGGQIASLVIFVSAVLILIFKYFRRKNYA
ncbi:MAG: Prolipoprotein diacylglyceryl transferase [Berkelbacteria bacterium GW2011_GWA1_36_9]|uniref:Phosphatidylglycerol--prolipoprotein diacylglyceryl transferase n=1 Tax=Berkelbacteria bacterium GW2011_GWA1_36_9 TaxID=1618331 RepID=A0A0G0HZR8_9BACT|nr:MAG: Prolipoprotein diacylglyceryl transferase [Berkelbacteria bacterium GW2011_GWA1_36_9]